MYRKSLDTAARATTFDGTAIVVESGNIWEDVAGVSQVKAGFGLAGVQVGAQSSVVSKTTLPKGVPDAETKLLLHMDDAALSDETGKSVTINGSAALSTDESVFGGGSVAIPAGGGYLSVPTSDDWQFGTGDFAIDLRVRFAAINANNVIIDVGSYETGVRINVQSSLTAVSMSGTAYNLSWTPSLNTWYHFALVRDGNSLRGFVNGTQIGTDQNVTGKNITTAGALTVGDRVTSGVPMRGYIDEVRVSKGTNRGWTSNFTPPVAAYTLSHVSANIVTAGTVSFAPATLGFTSDSVALSAPADLTAMDAAATVDYSFSASGADGVTGYTGSPITPTAFAALAKSVFTDKANLFLKFIPTAAQAITAAKLSTLASGFLLTRTGTITAEVDSIDVFKVEASGAVLSEGHMAADAFVADVITVASGEHTLDFEVEAVFCDTASGEVTVNLPASADEGRRFRFKRITPGANNVVIVAPSDELVEGAASLTLSGSGEAADIEYDGSNWWRMG